MISSRRLSCLLSMALFVASFVRADSQSQVPRPNILWLSSEDHGQEMGCYGDKFAETPNIDELAKRGLMYRNVWSCAPVCAPARTTIITGTYPTRMGAEHMRSMVDIPTHLKLLPTRLREAGYYCSNRSKEDYNVRSTKDLWNDSSGKAHWKGRTEGQPFFSVFNSTRSHESSIRNQTGKPNHDPAGVRVPAYHPDTPVVRRDWAIYYDAVTAADADAGKVLKELEADGLSESTIVFYWGDHGSGMPRSKRWPCNSGLRVPLVIYIPDAFKHLRPADYAAGGESDRLVSFVDFAPTVLSLAGVKPPPTMDGRAIMGDFAGDAPSYLFGFRGRMDERLDLVRSATDGRYVYLRNYMPHLSQAQHVAYQFETPTTAQWRSLFDQQKLNAAQSVFWSIPKASEELYDLRNDPDEAKNLASSETHRMVLEQFRAAHLAHVLAIRDVGFIPEGERQKLAQDRSIMEMGSEDSVYPIQRVVAAAALASHIEDQRPETIEAMSSMLIDVHPVIRYWGCMGLLMRGAAATPQATDQLFKIAQSDASDEVRVAAANAIVVAGGEDQRRQAIEILVEHTDAKAHPFFTVMAALRAIDQLNTADLTDDERTQLAVRVKSIDANGKASDARLNSYVPRLLKSLQTKWQGQPTEVNR